MENKKEILRQYKDREIIGGVYIIRNMLNNKILLESAVDLHSIKNRFEFSLKTGSCVSMKLQNDWIKQGGKQFVFEVLEELKKDETQSVQKFKADIDILKKLRLEKMVNEKLY